MSTTKRTQYLSIKDLCIDRGTQQRPIHQDKVLEYAELMREGTKFPPISVVYDGVDYIVWDGFHRYLAAWQAELNTILCEVENGDIRLARLKSYSANREHGIPLTNAEKRAIIRRILQDPDCAGFTQARIAQMVGVSIRTVANVQEDLVSELGKRDTSDMPKRSVKRKESSSSPEPESSALEPATEEEGDKMLDKEGHVVPEHLVPVFQKNAEFNRYIETINELVRTIKTRVLIKDRAYAFLPWNTMESVATEFRRILRYAAPYSVCLYCHAKDKECKVCKGLGFVNERLYQTTPEELKDGTS